MSENTLTSQVQSIVEKFVCESENFDIDPKALGFRIRLKGDRWKGTVDRNIARFLLALDDQVSQELDRQGIKIDAGQEGIIVLRIREGSTEAFFEYGKGLLESYRKMKTKDQVTLGIIILTSIGLFKASDIIDAVNKPHAVDAAGRERIKIIEATAKAVNENTRELQKPMRLLIRAMEEKDTIVLPNSSKSVSAEAATEQFEKGSRSAKKNFYIDHPYIVQALSTKNPDKWTISLSYASISFNAVLKLSSDEMQQLLRDFQAAHANGSQICPDLQVTAEITAKGVKSATVTSIGKPRHSSVALSKALTDMGALPAD